MVFRLSFISIFGKQSKGLDEYVHELHTGEVPLFSLNFGVITLIPKVKEANKIQQYRPICLLNVSFKIFSGNNHN
jgi:hypothetical protein